MLMVNQLVGFGVGSRPPVTITYEDKQEITTNLTTYNFNSMTISAGAPGKHYLYFVSGRGVGANATIASSDFDSVAATELLSVTNTTGAQNGLHLFSILHESGTPSGVDVVFDSAQLRASVSVFSMEGAANGLSPTDTISNNGNTDPISGTLTFPAGSAVLAGNMAEAAAVRTTTWTGVNETYDAAIEGTITHSGGFENYAVAGSGESISADFSLGINVSLLAAAAFAP